MDTPLLHLRLDEIQDGKTLDVSGNALDATVAGGARIVGDDTFGSCLELDGVDDLLDLPAGAVPAGEEISACVWLNGGASLPKACSVILALDASGNRTLNLHVPYSDGTVYFDHGNSGGGWDRVLLAATAEAYRGSWAHWAFVRETGGSMRIYRNGVEWASGTGKARTRSAAASVQVGTGAYPGKLAHLRVYDRAVTAAELARIIEDDQTALSSFRRSYPFDLYLHDGQDQEVLYITDVPGGKPLAVEVSNASGLSVNLLAPDNPTAGPQNYHFALRFRPGTLSASSVADAQAKLDDAVRPQGWHANAAQEADGTAALYFLHPSGATLEAGQTLFFTFPHASADSGGGARGTRVELRFGQLAFGGGTAPVTGRRLAHLNVVNHQGEREIPLHAGFVGNDVVLNDGTPQSLTLRISNTRKDGSIAYTGPAGDAPTRFVILFDVQAVDETRDWALGTTSQVTAIVPSVKVVRPRQDDEGWSWTQAVEGESPEWILAPPADGELGPGEWIEISLTNVISTLPAGPATLYARYQNVPGYWDGQLTAQLEKGRLVQEGDRVGIGTASPQESLHTTGSLRVDGGVIGSAGPLTLRPDTDGSGDGYVRFVDQDGDEVVRVTQDGKVGIGTSLPAEKLHIAGGNIRLSSGAEIQSRGPIHLKPAVDRTGAGDVVFLSTDNVEVLRVSTDGAAGTSGGRITKGVEFSASVSTPLYDVDGWSKTVSTTEGVRIEAGTAGVLGVGGADVLCWVSGHVWIKGKLSAYAKEFRIPHPTLPGRDLVHGCLEGPENGVYYRGTARLADGRAVVRLPDYFEALTRADGRTVQLTARGREPFVLSHGGVADGAFEVFGTKADGEFDWEVRAARADVAPLAVEVPAE